MDISNHKNYEWEREGGRQCGLRENVARGLTKWLHKATMEEMWNNWGMTNHWHFKMMICL